MSKKKKDEEEFASCALPKYIPTMTWDETEKALDRIQIQFKIIHDLPKIDGNKPAVYMHEALHGLRQMCLQLGDRRYQLLLAK